MDFHGNPASTYKYNSSIKMILTKSKTHWTFLVSVIYYTGYTYVYVCQMIELDNRTFFSLFRIFVWSLEDMDYYGIISKKWRFVGK